MIEGARRVGKSYIVKEFAQREYKSYILIDFFKVGDDIKNLFKNYKDNLDMLFTYLSTFFSTKCMLSRSFRSTLPLFLVMEVCFLPLVNRKVLRFAALRTIEAHRRACLWNSSAVMVLPSIVSVMVWLMAVGLSLPSGRPC